METLVVHPKSIEQQDLLEAIFKEMQVSFEKEKSVKQLNEWQKNELLNRSNSTETDFISAKSADEISEECFR